MIWYSYFSQAFDHYRPANQRSGENITESLWMMLCLTSGFLECRADLHPHEQLDDPHVTLNDLIRGEFAGHNFLVQVQHLCFIHFDK